MALGGITIINSFKKIYFEDQLYVKWTMKNGIKRKKISLGIVLIIALGMLLVARLYLIICINYKYEKGMNYDKNLGYAKYCLEEDEYIFRYRPANLINTDAFGTVCKEKDEKVYVDKEGKFHTKGLQITLYIWPFSHKMGVEFYEIHDGVEESEQIYIDKDINCVTKNLTNEQQKRIMALIDNNKDEIQALLEEAEDKWGL